MRRQQLVVDPVAYKQIRQLAELGQAKAQYQLGLMLANGVGVAQDSKEALNWYRKAAEKGYTPAQYLLGIKYLHGQGVSIDVPRGFAWLIKAGENGHAKALFRLGQLLSQPQDSMAILCYQRAAEKGLLEAQLVLTSHHQSHPASFDSSNSLVWCKAAAKRGVAFAQYLLGNRYINGDGVEADPVKAFHWYELAARSGFSPAQFELGAALALGRGCSIDVEQAIDWWKLAADQGDIDALLALGEHYSRNLQDVHNRLLAKRFYEEAAAHGSALAQFRLGGLALQDGDRISAIEWYRRAALQNSSRAKYALACALLDGETGPNQIREALDALLGAALDGDWQALDRIGSLPPGALSDSLLSACRKAAMDGDLAAQFKLSELVSHDGPSGEDLEQRDWLLSAAENGYLPAQHALAVRLLDEGGAGASLAPKWLREAADAGFAPAQSRLAILYIEGLLLPRDEAAAIHWWSLASEQNEPSALFRLGCLYDEGEILSPDPGLAECFFARAAEQGYVPAQLRLARLLLRADKYHQAMVWLSDASKSGDAEANFEVALLFWQGDAGVPPDRCRAFEHLFRAASAGLSKAQTFLAEVIHIHGNELAEDWLRLAAQGGDAAAQFALAKRIEKKSNQTAAELKESVEWCRKAAEQLFAPALAAMGNFYTSGVGLRKNQKLALECYQRAAELGDPTAQWNLGGLHAAGRGVPKDPVAAAVWCSKSAEQGFVPAMATLGSMYAKGVGVPQDGNKAMDLLKKAAAREDLEALYNLGVLHLQAGGGGSFEAAYDCLIKAAERGLSAAQLKIGLLYAQGENLPLDLIEAAKWFFCAAESGEPAAKKNLERAKTMLDKSQIQEARRRANRVLASVPTRR